jgi:folate-binding protein YgfZ
MLTAKGAMVGDGRVLKLDESLVLDTGAGQGAVVMAFLTKYLISEEAEVEAADDLAVLGLIGPEAQRWADSLPGDVVAGRFPGLLNSGVDVLLHRTAWNAVTTSLSKVPRLSEKTVEVLRVEAGVPKFGVEMTETTIPLEANLERAIHYQKGCYIGQEVIARATYRGQMNKKLVGLLLGDVAPDPNTELRANEKRVGRIVTVVRSERVGQNVALGYVHRDSLAPGTALEIASGGVATVCSLPF